MDDEEYSKLFHLERTFWWFQGMRLISEVLLDRYLAAENRGAENPRRNIHDDRRVLDAGCGTGGMLETLRPRGHAVGVDAFPRAVAFAKTRGRAPVVLGDVCQLPFASNVFDLVTSFDVIYHLAVSNDEKALREFARVLRPGGLLLLRVPSLDFCRGRHDLAVHTRHRYRRRELTEKLDRAGLSPEYVSYVNFLLLPVALGRRVLDNWVGGGRRRGSEVEPLGSWANQALYRFLWLEAAWIRLGGATIGRFPVGLSLVAVARKSTEGPSG
jgi:SAM-dependent methyltransferase